ncbi:MAG: DUF503 domain-containing protein [Longimicrobiales bacterium]
MVIGVITWEIQIFDARSLKEKRKVVKSLKERLQSRFNLSVAETAFQDSWQRAELTAVIVATDKPYADGVLNKADALVESAALGRIMGSYRDYY